MALSFLSLPPEVRVQIYRYLLCHHYWIWAQRISDLQGWPWDIHVRTMGTVTSSKPWPTTNHSLESAILRTCRVIYTEAMPVLYGENNFFYPCYRYILHQADCPKAGFPDKNLDFMKHLELEVQEYTWNVDSTTTESIVAAIQYFVRGGCDLRTFKLSLWENWEMYDSEKQRDRLVNEIPTSSALAASLLVLQVSESLTLSIWCPPFDSHYVGEIGKRSRAEYQGYVNRLASEKGMTAIMEVDLPEEEDEDDYDTDEDYDYDICKMSWCLRPQRSQPQSPKTTSVSD